MINSDTGNRTIHITTFHCGTVYNYGRARVSVWVRLRVRVMVGVRMRYKVSKLREVKYHEVKSRPPVKFSPSIRWSNENVCIISAVS